MASFINPHDICYMAIRAQAEAQRAEGKKGRAIKADSPEIQALDAALKIPGDMPLKEFIAQKCPPLPANFELTAGDPEGAWDWESKQFRNYVRKNWTEDDWRLHRWAYASIIADHRARLKQWYADHGETLKPVFIMP